MKESIHSRVYSWLKDSGRVWAFRILLIGSSVSIGIAKLGVFTISQSVVSVVILVSILSFGEMFFSEAKLLRNLKNEGDILDWNSAIQLIRQDVSMAKEVIIVARTAETFYYAIRDTLLARGKFSLTIVMTLRRDDTSDFVAHQRGWIKRWNHLGEELTGEIAIKVVQSDFEIQSVVIDDKVSYFGYRNQPVGTKAALLNHLRTSAFTTQGQFLLSYIKCWIENHPSIEISAEHQNSADPKGRAAD